MFGTVVRRLMLVNTLCLAAFAGGCAGPGGWDAVTSIIGEGEVMPVAAVMPPWGAPTVVAESTVVVETSAAGDEDGPYLLDSGDRLRIFVYAQPNLSRIYIVDQSGRIAVPLIGDVQARGRTTRQLGRLIAQRLGTQFVKDPQVTVDIAQARPFFILGEVRNAGQYPYVSGITVQAAVAIAGGYADRASERSVQITRRRHGGIVEKMDVPPDYTIQPGDEIYVYERWF